MKLSVKQEKEKSESLNKNYFTVSGDGTWKKHGFTSLYGVASLIAYYTGKIIDVVIKSGYCKACESWQKKLDTAEYEEWKIKHEPNCLANNFWHVQNRMGIRLRECKRKNKGFGGKGKLTRKMIDKLAVYYGLAIRRNCESAYVMENAIWSTYLHYSSADGKLQHQKCPPGNDSWREWQKQ